MIYNYAIIFLAAMGPRKSRKNVNYKELEGPSDDDLLCECFFDCLNPEIDIVVDDLSCIRQMGRQARCSIKDCL